MKMRTIFLAVIALASMTLSGCGNNNTSSENPSGPTNSAGGQMTPGSTNQNNGGNPGTNILGGTNQ
jgi:ABC-type oligopeptide transport system substrate-binding subunit